MGTYAQAASIFERTEQLISSPDFIKRYRIKSTDFIRNRKLGFSDIVHFILSIPKKTLPVELNLFLENNPDIHIKSYSKQAFSLARQKISEGAFKEIFSSCVDIMLDSPDLSLWKKYQILAIDGTGIQLPQTDDNSLAFGRCNGAVLSRVSALFDVKNDIIIDALFDRYYRRETSQAIDMLDSYYNKQDKFNSITIFDRGYNNYNLIEKIISNGQYFVIRCKKSFMKDFQKNTESDRTMYYKHRLFKEPRLLRIIKLDLGNGTTEILLSNLCNHNIRMEDFKDLYNMRWGIETKYNELKNRLAIENFSGIKTQCMLQDFYASLYFSNIASLIKSKGDEVIRKEQNEKNSKKHYQVSRNNLFGLLHNIYLKLMLRPKLRIRMLKELVLVSIKERSLIRPNRTREHKVIHPQIKNKINYKTNL